MLRYVTYVIDNVAPPWTVVKRIVFLVILAVTRIAVWETQLKELYARGLFSSRSDRFLERSLFFLFLKGELTN